MYVDYETRTSLPFGEGEELEYGARLILECVSNSMDKDLMVFELYKKQKKGDIPLYIYEETGEMWESPLYPELKKIAEKYKCVAIFLFEDVTEELYDSVLKEQQYENNLEGVLTGRFPFRNKRNFETKWFVAELENKTKILVVQNNEEDDEEYL